MILEGLVFTLGFLVAGLLALAALPAVWRRALRLSGERLARLVPLSPEEVAADRDHLRAAHAVDLRRTEQRLERAEAERVTLLAEASRHQDRIAALDRDGVTARAEIAALGAEGAWLRGELNAVRAEAGTALMALDDASGLADKRWSEAVDLKLENQRLADQIDRDRASVAGLETRLLGAETRAEDLARDVDRLRARMATQPPADAPADAAPSADAPRMTSEARDREIEHLQAELAFMTEQAASAERRATESAMACERLKAERAEAPAGTGPEPADDLDRLRAAIARLADDVMRITGRPEPTEAEERSNPVEPPGASLAPHDA